MHHLANFIPHDIFSLANIFHSYNFELNIVGGAIRDLLCNQPISDFDLATSASPSQLISLFKNYPQYSIIPTGINHGTLTIISNNSHFEVTSYRIDGSYSNNRHPDNISFTSSLLIDLSRRDFSMNAIAFDPLSLSLSDPFHGQDDINSKIIHSVGDPLQRFQEDALRMLRACRFATTLNFSIHPDTLTAISKLASNIQSISQERIRDELVKIIIAPNPSIGFDLLLKTGLLHFILPELVEGLNIDQNEFHKFDVFTHNIQTLQHNKSNDLSCRLASLLHDIGKPRAKKFALKIGNGNVFYNHEVIGAKMTTKLLQRLKFSNSVIHKTSLLVLLHMFYYTNEWSDGAIRRFLRKFDGDLKFLEQLFLLREADRAGSGTKKAPPFILFEFQKRILHILQKDNALKVADLNINGSIIMQKFDIKPSPLIGQILNYLLELVLDNPDLNCHDSLLSETHKFILKNQ